MKFPTLLQIQTPIKHLKTGSKRVRIKEAAGRRPPHKTQQCVHPRQATIGGCAVVSLNNQVDISKKYGDMTMLPFEFHYLLSLNWRKFPNSLHAVPSHLRHWNSLSHLVVMIIEFPPLGRPLWFLAKTKSPYRIPRCPTCGVYNLLWWRLGPTTQTQRTVGWFCLKRNSIMSWTLINCKLFRVLKGCEPLWIVLICWRLGLGLPCELLMPLL